MTTIDSLFKSSSLSLGDLLVLYGASDGSPEKAALSEFMAYIDANIFPTVAQHTKQHAYVTATDYSISVTDDGSWIWLNIFSTTDYADGEIVLPSAPVDLQEVWVTFNNDVTAVVVDGNGTTVVKTITTAVQGQTTRWKYSEAMDAWYRL